MVIALHGTGGSKANMLALCRKLAERGFIAVAIDGRYHGERKSGKGQTDYDDAIVRAFHGSGEHPFYYDTVWDVMRLVDYLQTRDDVDPARIGLIGISKGGIETYLAAAADPRIAVAVPCIGVESFRWALDNNDWQGRIGTIQTAFDAIAKEDGRDETRFRIRPKILRPRRAGNLFRIRRAGNVEAHRAASAARHQQRFRQPHAAARRQECVTAAQKIYAADNADKSFRRHHPEKHRPSGETGIRARGD